MKMLWVKEWCGTGVGVKVLCVQDMRGKVVCGTEVCAKVWCKNALCAAALSVVCTSVVAKWWVIMLCRHNRRANTMSRVE